MAGGRAQRRARRPKPSAGELLTEIIPEQSSAVLVLVLVVWLLHGVDRLGKGKLMGSALRETGNGCWWGCSFHGSPHCVICSECRDHRDLELRAP